MLKTPVLFLIFNRPDTTQKVFDSIRIAKPKTLFIAADGPRVGNSNDQNLCEITRKIVSNIDWPCEVKTLFRETNLGCGKAVSEAITWFFDQVDCGIVLEDDCLPELSFFQFCETMLLKYKDDKEIAIISGMNYLYHGIKVFNNDYFKTSYASIWGWASWKRVMTDIEWDIEKLKPPVNTSLFYETFPKHTRIADWLYSIINLTFEKKIDTWDTIFLYNLILKKMKNIMPVKNQISNIGKIGTHTNESGASPNLYTKTYNIDFYYEINCTLDDKYNDVMFVNIENLVYPKISFFTKLKNKICKKILN